MQKPRPTKAALPVAPPTLRTDVEFVMVPAELLTNPMLMPTDKLIAALMVIYARDRFTCWACNDTLGQAVRGSRSTVQRSLRRLEQTGWIAREPAPTTRRGNLMRLLWRYPRPKARPRHPSTSKDSAQGVSPATGGGVTRDAGGCHPCHTDLDSKPKFENPEARRAGNPEEDVLSEDDLAMWRGFQIGGDKTQRMLATSVLKRHELALGSIEAKKAAAGNLAKDPPAASKDTVLDGSNCNTKATNKSSPVQRTEHKSHYK